MRDVLSIESNLMGAACNCHGICVVKALIDKIGAHQTQYAQLLIKKSFHLSLDPFGNFAIQRMINAWGQAVLSQFICPGGPLLPTKIVEMSQQKFSSNVVDNLIENANWSQLVVVMSELEQSD